MTKWIMNLCVCLSLAVFLIACKNDSDKIPAPAQSVQQVKDFVKTKTFTSTRAGLYDNLTVNGKREVNWIDTTDKKSEMTSTAAAQEIGITYYFINDTAIAITKGPEKYSGTYIIDDKTEDSSEETPGIKLRLTYPDPEFSFNGEPSLVTYLFYVIGCENDKLLVQTSRTINRQKVLALYKSAKQ